VNLKPFDYHFEFLTPAWLGGAEPVTSAEVRIPTIRGHLRQWLRLLYPAQHFDEVILGRVAGESRQGQPTSSCVALSLKESVTSRTAVNLTQYTGARDEREAIADPESYFLWPLRKQSRGVLMPGRTSNFTLRVRWYPAPSNRMNDLQQRMERAVDAFSLLGAMGTRATRGYGSLWPLQESLADDDVLRQRVSFLPPSILVRLLTDQFDNGRHALAGAANWMRSFRLGSTRLFPGHTSAEGVNDHNVADPDQNPERNAVVYRHALGMPLTQRFARGRGNTTKVRSDYRDSSGRTDRYPSPLRLKVIRMGGKYRLLVVLLRDLLLEEGTEVTLQANGPYQKRRVQISHQLVDRMMQTGIAIH